MSRWCPRCEALSPDTAEECRVCGFRLVLFTVKETPAEKNRVAARVVREVRRKAKHPCPWCGRACYAATCANCEDLPALDASQWAG